ncbi:MAG: MFS transporter [Rhodothalassiaceae bacterium]
MPWSPRKRRAITALVLATIAAMSLWFSAAAIAPALISLYDLSPLQAGFLTSSVSAGFVAGTLISASFGLADRLDPRRFFLLATLTAAGINLSLLAIPADHWSMPVLRGLIGLCAAGIYPVGMRLAASWAETAKGRADTGLLVGLLVGALTLGSATPYLVDLAGGLSWQRTLMLGSALAAAGGVLILAVPVGPSYQRAAAFKASDALKGWTEPAMRLTNLGYLGHMWELYAMWAWIGAFLAASFSVQPGGPMTEVWAKFAAFAVIGTGAAGCLLGGFAADRIGRTAVTAAAMILSGTCALCLGFLLGGPVWLVLGVALIWGITVIADSAQFSAAMVELAPKHLTGTLLTAQTCLGFLLTMVSIQLLPVVREAFDWGVAFALLAVGPALGALAMLRLRARPEAQSLAGGRK